MVYPQTLSLTIFLIIPHHRSQPQQRESLQNCMPWHLHTLPIMDMRLCTYESSCLTCHEDAPYVPTCLLVFTLISKCLTWLFSCFLLYCNPLFFELTWICCCKIIVLNNGVTSDIKQKKKWLNGLLERTHKTHKTHTSSNVATRYKTKQLMRVNAYRHTGGY